jgi:hypothetical protein
MRGTIAAIGAGALLALAPAGAWAQGSSPTQQLEHLMMENANTSAQHKALADYYRTRATDAKSLADEHRKMAKSYTAGNAANKRAMKEHCDKIAELNDQLARQYEALAKEEDAAAKMK